MNDSITVQYTPGSKQEYWCNQCNCNVVYSDDSTTGKFYVQFGHGYNPTTKEYDGEYTGVMFAVCAECTKEEK